jgi:phage gpG-like protein
MFNLKVKKVKFPKFGKKYEDRLLDIMQAFVQSSVGTSKKEYLSGPRPEKLGVVTGRLRSSIMGRTRKSGKSVIGTIGSRVVYAPIHEFGGFTGRGRKVNIPARPFLGAAVEDNRKRLEDLIKEAVIESWEKE